MNQTKIIEFYGLPGSGKTTTCHELINKLRHDGYSAAMLADTLSLFSIKNVLTIFSVQKLWLFMKIVFSICHIRFSDYEYIFDIYKRMLMYDCIKKKSELDYVIIDHGMLQCFVSAFYGRQYSIRDHSNLIADYLDKAPINGLVFCNLSTEDAYNRIRLRNRKDSGRFDQLDDQMLPVALKELHNMFVDTDSIARMCLPKATIKIDAMKSTEEIVHELIRLL